MGPKFKPHLSVHMCTLEHVRIGGSHGNCNGKLALRGCKTRSQRIIYPKPYSTSISLYSRGVLGDSLMTTTCVLCKPKLGSMS